MLCADNNSKLLGLEDVIVKKLRMRGIANIWSLNCHAECISVRAVEPRQTMCTITGYSVSRIALHMANKLSCIFVREDIYAEPAASSSLKKTAFFLVTSESQTENVFRS